MKTTIALGAVGALLGFMLSRIGFSSWDEVHGMFTFASMRLFFTFLFGLVVLGIAWQVIARTSSPTWPPRLVHKGTLAGGVLFGAGWALSGACPSIALVQIGEGQLAAVITLVGILAGNWLYSIVHERWFSWSTGNCVDD